MPEKSHFVSAAFSQRSLDSWPERAEFCARLSVASDAGKAFGSEVSAFEVASSVVRLGRSKIDESEVKEFRETSLRSSALKTEVSAGDQEAEDELTHR